MVDYSNAVPAIQYGSRTIVQYAEILNRQIRSEDQIENEKNLRNNEYNGYMSPKTATKVRKFLTTWITGIEINKNALKQLNNKNRPYLTFLTLTLPSTQKHTDNEIKRQLLNAFIIKIKRNYNVKHYYWKAESQKNGNIHFHIVIDKYIHYDSARTDWNDTCNALGYVDEYTKKHINMSFKQYLLKNPPSKYATKEDREKQYHYSKSINWTKPNSTDIHKLNNVENTVEYILKYMCKRGDDRKIEGRIHGGSEEIRSLRPYQDLVSGNHWDLCTIMENDKSVKKIREEYHTIYCVDVMNYVKLKAPIIYKKLLNYYIAENRSLYMIQNKDQPVDREPIFERKKTIITIRRRIAIQTELFNYKNRS